MKKCLECGELFCHDFLNFGSCHGIDSLLNQLINIKGNLSSDWENKRNDWPTVKWRRELLHRIIEHKQLLKYGQ